MIFNTHHLQPPLAKYLEAVFHFKEFEPDHSIERVVPTGHLYIIFELDGLVRNTFDNDSLRPNNSFTRVWVSGMHRNYISISAHQKSEMFVMQFKAFGAYPFLHKPIHLLNEKIVPAEELFGESILTLREDLLKSKTSEAKFSQAEAWLNARFDPNQAPDPELLNVVEQLQDASVAHYGRVINSYSKTPKHLIHQFKKYIGLTPKYYQRILRFNEILEQIHHNERIEWAQVAYQCEYADQSHFIKEFKRFSGFNPREFIAEGFHKNDPNFFPLDRKG